MIHDNLPPECPEDVEAHWSSMKTIILNMSQKVPDLKTMRNQHWFDEKDAEIEQLISKNNRSFVPGRRTSLAKP